MHTGTRDSGTIDLAVPSASTPHRHNGRDDRRKSAPPGGTKEPEAVAAHASLVVADPASRALLELAVRIAPSDVPVLILGESGTGKEAFARYIHAISGRNGPFVAISCAAIASDPAEGESIAAQIHHSVAGACCEGWFSASDGGTLFLDEIGDLPSHLQAKLVCMLRAARTDVRIITAATEKLTQVSLAGHFRPDLLYRLNIAQLGLPPLRERKGDITALAEHFIRSYTSRSGRQPARLSPGAADALIQHPWPGNVRELENTIRLALLLAPAQTLEIEHLQLGRVPSESTSDLPGTADESADRTLSRLLTDLFQTPGRKLLDQLEGRVIAEAFHFTGRNQVRTAALLGISRNVLRTLLKKHRLYEIRAYTSANGRSGDED
jgi:DNA-binding NtrC family response regulator